MSPSDSPRDPPDWLKTPPLKLVPPAARAQTDDKPKHITCLAILPFDMNQSFDFYKEILQPALRRVLEKSPFYWQVIASHDSDTAMNTDCKEKDVKVYLVDISDENPNMILELGGILKSEKGKGSLVFALSREGTKNELSNRKDIQVIRYPDNNLYTIKELEKVTGHPSATEHVIEDVANALKQGLLQREDVRSLNSTERGHYLSPLILSELTMDSQIASAFAELCESMEVFVKMKAKEISDQLRRVWALDVKSVVITGYQKAIRDLLKKL